MYPLRAVAVLVLCTCPLFGGVVLDGSFGHSGALPGPNYMISAGFGKQVGNNLFQSFNQFNLVSSESATFTGPSNIQNILSRVTGGSPSSIDGTINSDIQGANLFFLNPAGVMFGPHAQLNVSGSFAVSTANYVKMADGGRFNANLGGGDTLTSAPVSAFGFLNSAPGGVSVSGSNTTDSNGNIVPGLGLSVLPGKSFSIVAGDIAINEGYVSGAGSRINLVSVGSGSQEVPSDIAATGVPGFSANGTVNFSNNSLVSIDSAAGGGGLTIVAGNFTLDNSTVSSVNSASSSGGNITIQIGENLSVLNGGFIISRAAGSGAAGNLNIIANYMTLNNGFISGTSFSVGRGADVTITVDQALNITGGAIRTGANSSGNAGNLDIHADTISIDDGGAILADTTSSGKGGTLSVHAGSLSIDGSAAPSFLTGIFADSNSLGIGPPTTGDAGNVTVTVGYALSIVGGGEISSSAFSIGKGGDVIVNARSIFIDNAGQPPDFTGIFAEAGFGTGNGGNVAISAEHVLLQNGGAISAQSFTSGMAGSVQLSARTLSLESGGTVSSAANSSGAAGSVFISTTGPVDLTERSSISTLSTLSDAGNIKLNSGGVVKLSSGSSITASAGTNGGSIEIKAPTLVYLSDSSITATAGTQLGSNGHGGAGGNITIDPLFIVLNNSLISANAAAGQGGNINLVSNFFFDSSSLITATGTTNNGTINITAPELDLGAELITLSGSLVDPQNQLQERCTALLQGDFSSFISIGRGGTEPEPDEPQQEF